MSWADNFFGLTLAKLWLRFSGEETTSIYIQLFSVHKLSEGEIHFMKNVMEVYCVLYILLFLLIKQPLLELFQHSLTTAK
jgi:hypothetical protein